MSDRAILVAVELTTTPTDLEPVFELAQASGWAVKILHVSAPETASIERTPDGDVDIQFTGSPDLSTEHGALLELGAAFTERGIEAEIEVLPGPTVDVIAAYAAAWNAALIVVVGGTHQVGHRRVMGSVVTTLLTAGVHPVLVVPGGSDEADAGYRSAVERLIEVIDREDHGGETGELRDAAVEELTTPTEPDRVGNPATRLRDALHRFETDHPTLTRAINDVSYYLSGMGI